MVGISWGCLSISQGLKYVEGIPRSFNLANFEFWCKNFEKLTNSNSGIGSGEVAFDSQQIFLCGFLFVSPSLNPKNHDGYFLFQCFAMTDFGRFCIRFSLGPQKQKYSAVKQLFPSSAINCHCFPLLY